MGNGNRGGGGKGERKRKRKRKRKGGKRKGWYTSRSRYMINALDFKPSSSLFSLLLNPHFSISTKSLAGYHHLTVVSNRRRHTCRHTYLTPILSRARTSGIAISNLLIARIFEKRLKDWFCPAISVSTRDFRYDTEKMNNFQSSCGDTVRPNGLLFHTRNSDTAQDATLGCYSMRAKV